MSSILLSAGIEEFILNCRINNLAPASIKSYREKFKKFTTFTSEDVLLSDINEATIKRYILHLQEEGLKDVTINTYLRAARALLYYCMDQEYVGRFKIRLPKQDEPLPKNHTDDDIAKLTKKPSKNCSFTEYKTWVLVSYLLGTGNRISTALEIKIKDVDLEGGYVFLRKTKNRKEQIIPTSDKLTLILMKYILLRKAKPDDYLFCNSTGGRADLRTTQQQIADYNRKRGISRTSCHSLRHTFARKYLMNGGDAFRLQKMLGHSDLSMVKKYVAIYSSDLKEGFNDLSPV